MKDAVSHPPAAENHSEANPVRDFNTSKHPYRVMYDDAPVYNVPVKPISEAPILLTEGDSPLPKIPVVNIDFHYIIDKNSAVVTRSRDIDHPASWGPQSDILIYDFVSKTLGEPLSKRDIGMYPVYAKANYVLAETTDAPMVYENGTLVLFDIKKRTETTIFRYGVEGVLTGVHPNSMTIFGNKVYFDNYTYEAPTSSLYSYDIASGELTVISESAMNPIVYRDDIWYFAPNEQGEYRRFCSLGGEVLENTHEIGDIVGAGDKLYTTRSMGEDAEMGTSLTGVFEWFSDTAIVESRKGNVIIGLKGNKDFIVWQTSMPHQPPCIYDVAENIVYEFNDYESCEYAFYMGEHTGIVDIMEIDESGERTGNEKYYIFWKE